MSESYEVEDTSNKSVSMSVLEETLKSNLKNVFFSNEQPRMSANNSTHSTTVTRNRTLPTFTDNYNLVESSTVLGFINMISNDYTRELLFQTSPSGSSKTSDVKK